MDFIKKINFGMFKYINDNIKELSINFNNDIHDDYSGNLVLNDRIISYYDYDLRERVDLDYDDNKQLYDFIFYLIDNKYINNDVSYVNLYNFTSIHLYDELYLYDNVFKTTKYYYILILIPILLFTIK